MLIDFILSIPYYLVLLLLPRSVWEGWLEDMRALEGNIESRMRADGVPNRHDAHKEWEEKNCTWRKTVLWKWVRRRWPMAIARS